MLTFITYNDRIKYKLNKEMLNMSKYYSINEFSKILGSFNTDIKELG